MVAKAKAGKGKANKKSPAKKSTGGAASKLAKLKGKWKEGNENKLADFEGWDDGSYNVKLLKAHLNESKNNRLQVTIEFEDQEGEYEYNTYKHCGLDVENNEDCLRYLQKDLRTLGYDDVDINNLEDVLGQLTEEQPEVSVQIKTTTSGDKSFKNCYINNLIEQD